MIRPGTRNGPKIEGTTAPPEEAPADVVPVPVTGSDTVVDPSSPGSLWFQAGANGRLSHANDGNSDGDDDAEPVEAFLLLEDEGEGSGKRVVLVDDDCPVV